MARKTKQPSKKDKKESKDKNDQENSVAPKSNYDSLIRDGLSEMKLSLGTDYHLNVFRQKNNRFHKT